MMNHMAQTYGGLKLRVQDGKRYGTGSVSDLNIGHAVY